MSGRRPGPVVCETGAPPPRTGREGHRGLVGCTVSPVGKGRGLGDGREIYSTRFKTRVSH